MNAPQIIYQARKFRVERSTRTEIDGRERVLEVIRHPGAAVILPILDDGRIVLIQNYRPAIERELLELPAGTIDPPESPLTCALRELKEETGYSAQQISPLVSFYSTPGICDEQMHVFVARNLAPGGQRLDEGEQIRLSPLEFDAALEAIRDGRILDAKSIAALLYYARFRT